MVASYLFIIAVLQHAGTSPVAPYTAHLVNMPGALLGTCAGALLAKSRHARPWVAWLLGAGGFLAGFGLNLFLITVHTAFWFDLIGPVAAGLEPMPVSP